MELYADFQKEMYNRKTLWNDVGFVVYEPMKDKSLYIHSIYIKPSKRKNKAGSKLMQELINLENPTLLASYVDKTSLVWEESLAVNLAYGFKIINENDTAYLLVKEL